jgi:ABC-type sugar transport system ATPase subunit
MTGAPAIETVGLSKTYRGGVRALAGLDLRIEHGEVFGFLGPNGAGKSTTIRLLLDLIRPTVDRASLLGLDSRSEGVEARRRVGYLPGDLRLFDRLTGRQQLDSLARMRGKVDPPVRDALVERFGVVLDRPIRDLGRLIDVDAVSSLRERSLRHVTLTFAAPVDPEPFAALQGVRIQSTDGAVLRLSAAEQRCTSSSTSCRSRPTSRRSSSSRTGSGGKTSQPHGAVTGCPPPARAAP